MGGSREAAEALLATLRLQRQVTGCDLPHRRHLVLEHVADPAGYEKRGRPSGVTSVTVIHTFWGGRVNRTLAFLLADALEERLGARVTVYHDEAAVMVGVPAGMLSFGSDELLALARPEEVERRVTTRLLASGLFGARFREAAQIALLLPRPGPQTPDAAVAEPPSRAPAARGGARRGRLPSRDRGAARLPGPGLRPRHAQGPAAGAAGRRDQAERGADRLRLALRLRARVAADRDVHVPGRHALAPSGGFHLQGGHRVVGPPPVARPGARGELRGAPAAPRPRIRAR